MADGFLGGLREFGRAVGEGGIAFTTGTPLPQVRQELGEARLGLQTSRDEARLASIVSGAQQLKQIRDPQQKLAFLQQRKIDLTRADLPAQDTDEGIALIQAGRFDELEEITDQAIALGQQTAAGFTLSPGQQRFTAGGEPIARVDIARDVSLTAAQREFAGLTEGLTAEQKQEARLIELGLSPRAVGSAIQTISAEGIAEEIGDAQATIKERQKFGELTGASRSKAIDSSFARIVKLDKNINNLDRAIAAVEAGAGVGAIESRFPSIRAASIELDQIQGELALDVIGAVTFGALSEGELNLSKQIALPVGLDGPQLIQHLRDRKAAQQKLRAWFNEQIDFLDQGGTIAGFLREKERQVQAGATPQTQQAGPAAAPIQLAAPTQPAAADQQLPEGAIIVNPQTGQRLQVVNGQLVEAP